RYLSRDDKVREELERLPLAQVSFNYLGQLDQVFDGGAMLSLARESSGRSRSLTAPRAHLLDVDASMIGGQLVVRWTYSEAAHDRATIGRLAERMIEALKELIDRRGQSLSAFCTPSDFPLAQLTEPELERVVRSHEDLEDIYRLSPLQQGMLLHSLF